MTSLSFIEDRNCWRVASADSLALIVDGEDYFRALRHALLAARHLVVMIGWDFDFEIEMVPGESDADGNAPDGLPNAVGPFLDALVDRRPELDIYLLKWSGGALLAPGRVIPTLTIKLMAPEQIHLAFDGRHPIGACHHQKIVVVDDALAFCGGIDVTAGRWDTRAHRPGDLRRRLRSGEIAQAWHDAAAVLSGPAAAALGELARARWERANDALLPEAVPVLAPRELWPKNVPIQFCDVPVAIARTHPPERDTPAVAEIEQLYLDAIAASRDCIYLESQYFAADSITRAIAARLVEPDGPEIVVINPEAAQVTVETATDYAIFVTDAEDRITDWLPGAAAVFGWSAEEARGGHAMARPRTGSRPIFTLRQSGSTGPFDSFAVDSRSRRRCMAYRRGSGEGTNAAAPKGQLRRGQTTTAPGSDGSVSAVIGGLPARPRIMRFAHSALA